MLRPWSGINLTCSGSSQPVGQLLAATVLLVSRMYGVYGSPAALVVKDANSTTVQSVERAADGMQWAPLL